MARKTLTVIEPPTIQTFKANCRMEAREIAAEMVDHEEIPRVQIAVIVQGQIFEAVWRKRFVNKKYADEFQLDMLRDLVFKESKAGIEWLKNHGWFTSPSSADDVAGPGKAATSLLESVSGKWFLYRYPTEKDEVEYWKLSDAALEATAENAERGGKSFLRAARNMRLRVKEMLEYADGM